MFAAKNADEIDILDTLVEWWLKYDECLEHIESCYSFEKAYTEFKKLRLEWSLDLIKILLEKCDVFESQWLLIQKIIDDEELLSDENYSVNEREKVLWLCIKKCTTFWKAISLIARYKLFPWIGWAKALIKLCDLNNNAQVLLSRETLFQYCETTIGREKVQALFSQKD